MEVQVGAKQCPVCLETDPSLFGPNKAKRDGLQVHCRRCKKAYQDEWYAKNQQRHIQNVAVRHQAVVLDSYRQSYLYLKEHPCVVCGETDLYLLQYDHNQGVKHQNVSDLIAGGIKWETILKKSRFVKYCAFDATVRRRRVTMVR